MADDKEIEDRLSRRFGDVDEDDEESSQTAQNEQTSQTAQAEETETASQTDMSSSESQTSQTAQKAQNIKKEWNVRSIYLSDNLDNDLTTAYKRLDFELSEADSSIDLQKTRHFYPLLVELGLERLEELDTTEVTERLERTDDE
jgi:hypothetical protein